LRCFIAIELPETLKSILSGLEEEFKKTESDIKWVNPNNIHLTLKFLGNIREEMIEKITELMRQICSHYSNFTLNVRGIGVFPSLKAPRVLWVGIENNETLQALQQEIEEHMSLIGFEKESRKFTPHLTLGRFRSSIGKNAILDTIRPRKEEDFGQFSVHSISLMKSDLNPEGARYTRISEVPLKDIKNNLNNKEGGVHGYRNK
jgi:2'-5' RNA ligase